jgi:hypothetical protein
MPELDSDRNGRSIENLVEHVRNLPVEDRLELLRRIAPMILASLEDEDREELVADLNMAIARGISASRHAR